MDCLRFVVPGRPVPCERPRFIHGRAITPPRTRAYQALVSLHATAAVCKRDWTCTVADRYRVDLKIYRAANMGDWDNYSKSVCDGMNTIVYADDRHVLTGHVDLFVSKRPRVEVVVTKLDPRDVLSRTELVPFGEL